MNEQKKIDHYEIVNDLLLIKWDDDSEADVTLKVLRDNCPCANCAGEKDVFGNVYKGQETVKTDASYRLMGIEPVGYYGLRPFWGDNHSTGIFTGEMLIALSEADG